MPVDVSQMMELVMTKGIASKLLGLGHSGKINHWWCPSDQGIHLNTGECVCYNVVRSLDMSDNCCKLGNVIQMASLSWGMPIGAGVESMYQGLVVGENVKMSSF